MLADSLCLTCQLIQHNTDACLGCEAVRKRRPDSPDPREDTVSEEEALLLADLVVEGDLFSG